MLGVITCYPMCFNTLLTTEDSAPLRSRAIRRLVTELKIVTFGFFF